MLLSRRLAIPEAKISLPWPAPGTLGRARLHQRLQGAAAAAWICGPPAVGKTVLAASCLRAQGTPVLWYQVDSGDSDPGACFHFLARAAEALLGRRRNLPRLGRETGADLGDFARAFVRSLLGALPEGSTLVFDDWHLLPDGHPLRQALPELLAALSPGQRLWILSRHEPGPDLDDARLRGRLLRVGLAELALTVDETAALLAQQPGPLADADAPRWHRWCEGWVGALMLALAAGRQAPQPPEPGDPGLQPLFAALASELFERADGAEQAFMLASAWPPVVRDALARRLLPGPAGQQALQSLVQRQLLAPVPLGRESAWRWHPLMRDFLQQRARAAWGETERARQLSQLAGQLKAEGWIDEAADRMIEAGDGPALAALLREHADALLEQGRYRTLEHWAGALPEALRTPAIELVWAAALLARDARLGQQAYERAWQGFWHVGDADGLYRAWCGVIESTTYACDDYGVFERWLERLREMRQRHPRWPSLTVRLQVAVFRFAAGFFLHPRPPEFDRWLRSVQRLYRFVPRRGDRAAIGALLGLHHAAHGGAGVLGAHMHGLRPLLDDPAVPPFHRLVGGIPDMCQHWIGGDPARALDRFAAAEALARDSGAHAIDTQFAFQALYAHLVSGQRDAADQLFARIAPRLPGLGRLDAAQHRFLLGWRALLAGQLAEAHSLLDDAVRDMRQRRFAFLEAITGGLLAEVLALLGQAEAARRLAEQALALARTMGSVTAEVPCAMQRAAVAELGGEAAEQRRLCLAQAFGVARAHGHWAWGGLYPPTLARLAQRALAWRIEPDYARELVRRRALPPPPEAGAEWPWPVVVRGFGALDIRIHGQPLAGSARAAQRPLDLLRALLAQAPLALPVNNAMAWIWPGPDTTDQRKAFDVALLRARRLLGDDQLLRLEGGQLSFDPARVWTDVAALLALADDITHADAGTDAATLRQWAARWLETLRGPLLPEHDADWVRAARERLRRRAGRAAERLAALLAPGEPALARELLQRAFDADPASEALARSLALALLDRGDLREARRVLALCRSTRTLTGEAPLADETLRLAARLGA